MYVKSVSLHLIYDHTFNVNSALADTEHKHTHEPRLMSDGGNSKYFSNLSCSGVFVGVKFQFIQLFLEEIKLAHHLFGERDE